MVSQSCFPAHNDKVVVIGRRGMRLARESLEITRTVFLDTINVYEAKITRFTIDWNDENAYKFYLMSIISLLSYLGLKYF